MDDLWGNAWSQPDEDVGARAIKSFDETPWKQPASPTKDEEADIGLPSWSTGAIKWAEPTGEASLWTSEVAADDLSSNTRTVGWGGDTELDYGSAVSVTESHDKEEDGLSAEPEEPDVETNEESEALESSLEATPVVEAQTIAPESEVELQVHAHVDNSLKSSELFGSFEAGLDNATGVPSFEGDESWGAPVVPLSAAVDEDAWGSGWDDSTAEEEQNDTPKDEWEVAREEKLRRDRAVPPELIASIMSLLNELPSDLWPQPPKTEGQPSFGNWRDGMENVDGLKERVNHALPGITVHPPIQFSRSHTAKAMASSVKLSKNLPVVRQSPMAHLFTAKSSTAWEISVKSKVETPKDDIPAGWRTVNPMETDKIEQKPQNVEKKSGGFLSFLSRRTSTAPTTITNTVIQKRERSASPAPSKASGTASVRASVDVQPMSEKMQPSLSLSSIASDSPAPAMTSSASLPLSLSSFPISEAAPTSQSQELVTEPSTSSTASPPAPVIAPSAVSRFFNRFSRTSSDSRRSSSSPRSSIALSTDDIEFLSDIVPSHNDDMDEDDQLSALTAMVSSPATMNVPSKLPPPLAPPPRRTTLAQTPPLQPQSSGSRPSSIFNDLDAFSTMSSGSASSALPPPLPPPLSPTSFASLSKPATPSPLGNGHSRTSSRSSIPGIASPPSRTRTPISPPLVGLGMGAIPHASLVKSSPALQPLPLPPQSVSSQLEIGNPGGLATPAIPPPLEKSPGRVYGSSSSKPHGGDVDDFDFFHTSPSSTFSPAQAISTLGTQATASAMFSDNSTFSSHDESKEDEFGDFGDFISTVPPPAQPAVPPPPPKKHVPANIQTHIRKPSAADRQAAADLVERAAAQKGRWPAPPSPIPELIPPPPPAGARSMSPLGSSITLRPIAQITSTSRSSTPAIEKGLRNNPSPALLPPPTISGRPSPSAMPSLLDLDSTVASSPTPPPSLLHSLPVNTSSKPSVPSSQGGLSAQDLSFFEGL